MGDGAGHLVRLVPWGAGDAPLLARLVGDPAMMAHLGGPETAEQIADRQVRYALVDSGMFKIVDAASGEGVGSVGYWERTWRDEPVYEVGWSVVPEAQGRGIAVAATARLVELVAQRGTRSVLEAFPSVANAASNAICRRVGFTLLGACDVEYPPGRQMRCNDWRLELG